MDLCVSSKPVRAFDGSSKRIIPWPISPRWMCRGVEMLRKSTETASKNGSFQADRKLGRS